MMKGWTKASLIVIPIIVSIAVGYLFFFPQDFNISMNVNGKNPDARPKYCLDNKCVDDSVFADLPAYPKNFADVKALTYPEPYLGMFENFSMQEKDESYYKQPEFYGDSWKSQWVRYYTTDDVKFRCCSGPYPGDQMVSNLTVGDTYRLATYWHAGPAVWKYQIIKLIPTFPEYAKMRMGTEEVYQDAEQAKKCVDISVDPVNLIIEPTFPKLYYGWTQKVTLDITPRCPGRWFVTMEPGGPDPEFEKELIWKYGLSQISTMRAGGLWNILLVVNQ